MTTQLSAVLPLDALLITERPEDFMVATTPAGSRSWRDFLSDTAAVARWLRSQGAQRCLIAFEDAYDVAVSFVGAAEAGCSILLPANLQPEHLIALARLADCVLGDACVDLGNKSIAMLRDLADRDRTAGARQRLDLEETQVWIHTSGSTGEPIAVVRPASTLAAEVGTLEATFGLAMGRGPILATVPPYHIYGLLFRVLWPLAAGRPIDGSLLRYPPEVMTRAAESIEPAVIVSSPAFLSRALPVLDLVALQRSAAIVFSSGGPLAPAVGAAFNANGVALVEVYGSTETGGIAHRRVFDADQPEAWTPFRGVKLRRDETSGQLLLQSPHQFQPGELTCADRISPLTSDGRFELLGRSDRVVKVEEKRLSLDELEHCLRALPEVDDARFVPIERQGRTALGAVIVPSAMGWSELATHGRGAVLRRLSDKVTDHFASAGVPRQWRVVRALPANPQGKVVLAELRALFSPQQGRRTEPLLLRKAVADDGRSATLRLRLEPDIVFFDGHFADLPVLPGVAQLGWAIGYGRELFAIEQPFSSLEAIKFFRIASVGAELDLQLRHDLQTGKVYFGYTSMLGQHSSGRIAFGVRS